MEKNLEKELHLIFWHLDNIGRLVAKTRCGPEVADRLGLIFSSGTIVAFAVDDAGDCILKHVQDIVPREDKERLLPEVVDQRPLFICPFLKSDARIHPAAASIVNRHRFAAYDSFTDCIYLNLESCETHRFMASTLLHEAKHADLANLENRCGEMPKRDPRKRLEEELKLQLFDCSVAQELGGTKLKRSMDATITEICKLRAVGRAWKGKPGVGRPLDACYYPPKTKEARDARDRFYVGFCSLLALKRYEKDSFVAHKLQLEYLASSYDV